MCWAAWRCPLGAHYLPLPGPQAHEVQRTGCTSSACCAPSSAARWPTSATSATARRSACSSTAPGTTACCRRPTPGSATLAQYRRFAQAVTQAQARAASRMPSVRAPWTPAHAALDAIDLRRLAGRAKASTDAAPALVPGLLLPRRLRRRPGHGLGLGRAALLRQPARLPGAGRRRFRPRRRCFTWPEGNAWLAARLAAPLGDRLHGGRTVLRVAEQRHAVTVSAWDEAAAQRRALDRRHRGARAAAVRGRAHRRVAARGAARGRGAARLRALAGGQPAARPAPAASGSARRPRGTTWSTAAPTWATSMRCTRACAARPAPRC